MFNSLFKIVCLIELVLISDPRFREAHRIDEQITSLGKKSMGYALITGQKPG